ncbi:YcxB family protein [Actinocorallia populi]|uniref:YcxB family protein n=1 Tax=Actinocorallia populi TaxID=2079200 RepID=UPI000D088C15|nr:YcxB family protein [Actinocorallia populi]
MVDFTVRYQPTPDDVVRAAQHGLKRQLRTVRLVLPAVLVASGTVCVLVGAVSTGVGMFAGAVVAPFAMSWGVRRTARRQLTYICVPTTIRVTDDGYECRTDQSATTVRWSMFGQIVSTPESWLFFVDGHWNGFLPRCAFDGGQQAELDDFFAARRNAGVA